MNFERERTESDELVDGNKNETEIPIGDVQDVETRDQSMWQCGDCGEMGTLVGDDLPERCPECTAPREELYYRVED